MSTATQIEAHLARLVVIGERLCKHFQIALPPNPPPSPEQIARDVAGMKADAAAWVGAGDRADRYCI